MPENTLRFAVAQSTVRQDPTDADGLRASGAEVRRLMQQAADAGARLVHFTEGAICFPSKHIMSELGPDEIGPSDWSKADWTVLQDELDRITKLSRELGIWTVIPSIHQLPTRPHNSVYVVSDQGTVVARYDERMLSTTKLTWMYTPGTEPVTVDVDGYRFGLALGLDVLFPELFTEYDRLDADAVLVSYSTTGSSGNEVAPTQARGFAAANTYWISLAVPANPVAGVESSVIDPTGKVVAEGPADSTPGIAVTDLHRVEVSRIGREFRRRTRERVNA
ncbi:putative amidohydrolase [Kribbella antiqua]|uniref:Putative amidohydrolase n=1 Tax=Kribbella antiqua TaxID=2512217 RepID=A0A4R2IR35_9ACTN|nr:carbon-nitrogen hydrolase family protein [Kribbella antiqua]TCO47831.1 putative amidohydrolase [Kribbella antiqua]